jgi:hypothetical protein
LMVCSYTICKPGVDEKKEAETRVPASLTNTYISVFYFVFALN